jgi:hypothetical protein
MNSINPSDERLSRGAEAWALAPLNEALNEGFPTSTADTDNTPL